MQTAFYGSAAIDTVDAGGDTADAGGDGGAQQAVPIYGGPTVDLDAGSDAGADGTSSDAPSDAGVDAESDAGDAG